MNQRMQSAAVKIMPCPLKSSIASRWAAALVVVALLIVAFMWVTPRRTGPMAIVSLSESAHEVPRFCRYELEFDLNRDFDNPFDPDEIDVQIEIEGPDGARKTHPGFWDVPHHCVLDHGREVVRRVSRGRWKVRVSPMAVGPHRWTLTATTKTETAAACGGFVCSASERRGFVRVSEADARCLEFTDGEYFYPIGHCIRSPVDDRWRAFIPGSASFAERYAAEGTFSYAKWFAKMRGAGENFCAMWMAPWWCGLEWSPTQRGYEGIGRYNQRNAARLDHIVDLADEHGIYLLLYMMNHGMLSSATDPEWYAHPYNRCQPRGMLENASQFFESREAQRLDQNRLRYMLARWGYSPAVAVWGIVSEVDWVEAYRGKRSVDQKAKIDGGTESSFEVPARRDLVVAWLRATARFLKKTDTHPHIVSVQVSQPTLGGDVWQESAMEIVMTNAYTPIASEPMWQGEHWVGSKGVADALFVVGKKFERYTRPQLAAEWGGTFLKNYASHLEAELHTGLWTASMTNLAGATGFWWWNAVDKDDLYPHFRAVARFAEGEDRRGNNCDSRRAAVVMEFSPFSKGEAPLYAPHPRQSALVRFNADSLRGYVYCREINDPQYARPAEGFDDVTFPESGPCLLELPERLSPGKYRTEFWNTFTGDVFLTETLHVAESAPRMLPLPPHRVDLAIKMDRVED